MCDHESGQNEKDFINAFNNDIFKSKCHILVFIVFQILIKMNPFTHDAYLQWRNFLEENDASVTAVIFKHDGTIEAVGNLDLAIENLKDAKRKMIVQSRSWIPEHDSFEKATWLVCIQARACEKGSTNPFETVYGGRTSIWDRTLSCVDRLLNYHIQ